MKRLGPIVLAVIALILLATPVVRAEEAARILPDSTIFYLSVDDVSATAGRFSTHPLKALWEEPDVKAFMEPLLAQFEGAMNEAKEKLAGASPTELLHLTKGQLAIAFTGVRSGTGGMRIGMVAVAEIGDDEEALRTWIAKMEAGLSVEENARRTEEDFRGTTIVTYLPLAKEGEEKEEVEVLPSWCVSDGLFVVSLDPELLREMLGRRAEEGDTGLSSTEDFRRIKERCGGTGDVFLYVNMASAWQMLPMIMNASGAGEAADQVMKVVDALGLTGLRAFGAQESLTPEGLVQRGFFRMPGARTGLLRLFSAENGPVMPPRFVSPDSTTAMTMRLDLHGFWQEVRKIADSIEPGTSEQLDAGLAGLKEQLGVDIEKDLIGSLGDTMTFYTMEGKPIPGIEAPVPVKTTRMVFALDVANVEKLTMALNTLLAKGKQSGMFAFEDQEYLGVPIHVMDMGMMSPGGMGMGFGIVGDQLVFATDADDLKAVIRVQGQEDAATLVSSDAFSRAMTGLPRLRTMVTFTDLKKTMEEMSGSLQILGMMLPGLSGVDFSKFPTQTLMKYFDVSGGVMVNEDDGLSSVSVSRMKVPPK